MNCNSNTAPLLEETTGVSCNNGCTPKDINVICKKIVIPYGQETIGLQGENNASTRYFLIPKINENNDDLSDASFNIKIKNNSNEIISVKIENPEILENYIKIKWDIDSTITKNSGKIQVQIEAEKDNYIWKTYPAVFIVASSL